MNYCPHAGTVRNEQTKHRLEHFIRNGWAFGSIKSSFAVVNQVPAFKRLPDIWKALRWNPQDVKRGFIFTLETPHFSMRTLLLLKGKGNLFNVENRREWSPSLPIQ